MAEITKVRVDFSIKREVFFVVIGAIVGAIFMILPISLFEVRLGLPYSITWLAFGHIVGVYSSSSSPYPFSTTQVIIAGVMLHIVTAISIGIAVGIFLYKTGILNISKLSNGLLYGILAGCAVYAIFFIPVYQLILAPEISHTLAKMTAPANTSEIFSSGYAVDRHSEQEYYAVRQYSSNLLIIMISWFIIHLIFGVTVGIISSLLSIKFGSRYRCSTCDISFSRIDSYQKHIELIHGAKPIQQKHILILGGGFAGIEALRKLQHQFQNDIEIDITLVSRDNFFLFTPMLPEISSGMIETRHIATPVRTFCKRAKFYEANVESIDLQNKQVTIGHIVGDIGHIIGDRIGHNEDAGDAGFGDWHSHKLKYNYLVLALGSETNFFGMHDVEQNSYTLKSLGDAIILRNHIINMLEQADLEHDIVDLRKGLMTFVVVGGGFSGVETVGGLNDFVRDSIKEFYHNIEENKEDVRIILVNSQNKILPEVNEDLAEFALQKLRQNGVEIMLNTRVSGATSKSVKLNDGTIIPTYTLIWTGGVMPDRLIRELPCDHYDKDGRISVDNFLVVPNHLNVFAIGDCAYIIDPHTGKPYPPTAQHAVREGKTAAKNLISLINSSKMDKKGEKDKKSNMKMMTPFDYKTKGIMAVIGKRNGVGILFGYKVHGFVAWWIWRSYYLSNLPTVQKKLRVMVDWSIDLFFKRDITRIRTFTEEKHFLMKQVLKRLY
jgi:NADH:quinone reductase (non-electrogenic)